MPCLNNVIVRINSNNLIHKKLELLSWYDMNINNLVLFIMNPVSFKKQSVISLLTTRNLKFYVKGTKTCILINQDIMQ
jgi:hypothetical protein